MLLKSDIAASQENAEAGNQRKNHAPKGRGSAAARTGFHNAGQKMVTVLTMLASFSLMTIGAFMCDIRIARFGEPTEILRAHSFLRGGLLGNLSARAYCAPGKDPALRAMFTGYVPKLCVKHIIRCDIKNWRGRCAGRPHPYTEKERYPTQALMLRTSCSGS